MIAKLATRRAKPAGVHIVAAGREQEFLRTLDLADLPGVGPTLVEALRARGLVRVVDALGVQLEWLQEWLGSGRGAWLYRRIRGMDESDVEPAERRKSISSERTFSRDLDLDETLERRLLELSISVASTLRRKRLRARTVTVKLRDRDFRTRTRSLTVPEPIESDAAICEVTRRLLVDLRLERRVPARLLGVGLAGLSGRDEPRQLGLFSDAVAGETERDRDVSRAVDRVRERFGDGAVRRGRLLDEE